MGTATWWAGSMVFEGPRGWRGPTRWAVESPERPPACRRVVFPGRQGEPIEAILRDDGTWSCSALPVIVRVLDALYAPESANTGEPGWGRVEMLRAAEWLKGRVVANPEAAR